MSARCWDRVAYALDAFANAVERVAVSPIRRLERRAYHRWLLAWRRPDTNGGPS